MPSIPKGYKRMDGSERRPSARAEYLGVADPNEQLTITIMLRRRPGGPSLPDMSRLPALPKGKSRRYSAVEFAAKYGADPTDISRVVEFAESHSLKVLETHAARRTVVVSGTVAQMNKAFAVELGRYKHDIVHRAGDQPLSEIYRGRDGFVHVPEKLAKIIVGVFGLDNRSIDKHNSADDPPSTNPLTVPEVARLYKFPTNSARNQTIGIVAVLRPNGTCGYNPNDITQYYTSLNAATGSSLVAPAMPLPVVSINGVQNLPANPDVEATMDICIASTVAQGATIALYFKHPRDRDWIDLMGHLAFPGSGEPTPSVLSCSFFICEGDDAAVLGNHHVSQDLIRHLSEAFRDATMQGLTIVMACGDAGSDSNVGDGKAHVQYPGSDPWVLSCGGTTVGNINGSSFEEYVWNDDSGATGGGVSALFPVPKYQKRAGVPPSLNDGYRGRGVPDISGNGSGNSGYWFYLGGAQLPVPKGGTSAVAPLYAGLIALINASLRHNVGFLNRKLYAHGSRVCRDVNPTATNPPSGPTDNGLNGVQGYPAKRGWDACTGWGSINGVKLLAMLRSKRKKKRPPRRTKHIRRGRRPQARHRTPHRAHA